MIWIISLRNSNGRHNLRKLTGIFLILVFVMGNRCDAGDSKEKGGRSKFQWLKKLADQSSNNSSKDTEGTTVAGVRGLEETGRDMDTKARDYAAMDRLEKVHISDDELKTFLGEGKLGG